MKKKIAVPTTDGILDPHFGHCDRFTVFDVENDEIRSETQITAPLHEPGKLPPWLAEQGVTAIIAGGMGQRAIQLFNQLGVDVFCGAPIIPPEELIYGYLRNSIKFAANYCDH